jgi:hypothetical protein
MEKINSLELKFGTIIFTAAFNGKFLWRIRLFSTESTYLAVPFGLLEL